MRTRLAATLVTLALAVAGCSTGAQPGARPAAPGGSAPAPSPAPRFSSYVALGDSYTAAPLVPTTALANGCLRSDHNYPTLLARRLHVRHFTDVSCSGAKTSDLTHPQHTYRQAFVPPQLRAVQRDTDLVTVGIGGNDFDLFGSIAFGCTGVRGTPGQCVPRLRSMDVAGDVRRIGDRVAAVLREIERRAPHATVVLVGYLRLLPDHGSCAQVGSLTGSADRGASLGLADAMRSAARRTGVRFLDAYRLSKGHDLCSPDPWVNGPQNRQGVAAAFHPLASGEAALADRLDRMLS